MTAASAPDAESLACATAARYAGRWARSMARAPEQEEDAPDPRAPWFIDGFAGADLQRAALRGAAVHPAAIAAVQALGEGTRIVLVEEDPGLIIRLRQELDRAGAGERVRLGSDPASTGPGEIALVEASFASVGVGLANAIGDEPALVRLAPLAARALPWAVLEPLAELAATDVLLRLPLEDFARQARFTGPLADFPPHLRRVVEGCSALLADTRHAWIGAWREAQRAGGADAAPPVIVARMQALLAGLDADRSTHALPVAGAGGPVHLLLSTPHAAHALELDEALADAAARPAKRPARKSAAPKAAATDATAPPATAQRVDEAPAVPDAPASPPPAAIPRAPASAADEEIRPAVEPDVPAPPPESFAPEEPIAMPDAAAAPADDAGPPAEPAVPAPPVEPAAPSEPAPVLDLFTLAPQPEPEPRGPDLSPVAEELHARHVGTKVTFDELLASLAETGLAPEQVRGALALLKRAGRATYRSLDADGAAVEFLAEARVAAPRPRKARKPAPGELGLFDEPEE